MSLIEIRTKNVRNLTESTLSFNPGLNIISGDNASGKTSLLEAIFLLSRTRSFRTHSIKNIINKDQDVLIVSGKTIDQSSISQIGIKKSKDKTVIRINGKDEKKTSELLSYFQVHLIRPETQMLLEKGPSLRRSFLDWGVFHVKPSFLLNSKRHTQALKQRNTLLRKKQVAGLGSWNHKLAEYGTIISKDRENYIELLLIEFTIIAEKLLGLKGFRLTLKKGWDKNLSLIEALEKSQSIDVLKGYSHVGCHRADFQIHINGLLAQDFLSRGQMKLLVLSLCLAQVGISSRHGTVKPCVLIDDLAAELDEKRLLKVMQFLESLDAQIILTTTDIDRFAGFIQKEQTKVFHVEHGVYQELIE